MDYVYSAAVHYESFCHGGPGLRNKATVIQSRLCGSEEDLPD